MKLGFKRFSLLLFLGFSLFLVSCNKDDSNPSQGPNGPDGGAIENFGFLKAWVVRNNDTIQHNINFEMSHAIGRDEGEELYEIFIPAIDDNDATITILGRLNGVGTYEFVEDSPDDVPHSTIGYSDENYKLYVPSLQYEDSYCTLNITEYSSPFPAFVQKSIKGNFSAILYDVTTDSKVEILNGEFEVYVTNWSGY